MSSLGRVYIPPKQRGLGTPPNCDPYYTQHHLPNKGAAGTPGAHLQGDNRERFHVFGSITTPAAGTLLSQVTTYTVPDGNNAKVVGLLFGFSGNNFNQGDASLLYFSLRVNGAQYVQNYDNVPFTLGSNDAGPWPIPAAINLFAGDLIEGLASVPGGSGISGGRIQMHLVGYYWPLGA